MPSAYAASARRGADATLSVDNQGHLHSASSSIVPIPTVLPEVARIHRRSIMQLSVATESAAALTSDGTIRCFLDTKYAPASPSRHSSVAIALAEDVVDEFTTALLTHLDRTTTSDISGSASTPNASHPRPDRTATRQLNAVQLVRGRMRVCFDLSLDTCPPEVRKQTYDSLARPIHAVVKSGDSCCVMRKPGLDTRVADRLAQLQSLDHGPRPYFTDAMNPPCYVDGVRIEDMGLFET